MQKGLQLVTFGKISKSVLDDIVQGLRQTYNLKVDVGQEDKLPVNAYDSIRHQYLADKIVDFLAKRCEGKKILGITDQDLYTEPLNFVFGQAQLNGGVALLSIARLNPTFYGEKADKNLLTTRAVKEAIHEVGHVLGLRHCTTPRCVMQFSNSLPEVDEKSKELCWKCKLNLRV
jgi:archaemetzincin